MKQTATVPNATVLAPLPPPTVTLHPFPDAVGSDRNGPCIPCAPLNILASPLMAKSLPVQVAVAVPSCTSSSSYICTVNPVQISAI